LNILVVTECLGYSVFKTIALIGTYNSICKSMTLFASINLKVSSHRKRRTAQYTRK